MLFKNKRERYSRVHRSSDSRYTAVYCSRFRYISLRSQVESKHLIDFGFIITVFYFVENYKC